MRNSKAVFSEIVAGIHLNEGLDEKKAIAAFVMDHIFHLSGSEVMLDKPLDWQPESQQKVESFLRRINRGEPVQYVAGEAWFLGRKFKVDSNVLIPRPETEELVGEAISYLEQRPGAVTRVVDVGTGSGCISVSLALNTSAIVIGTDVSEGALRVANENANMHNVEVSFIHHDIISDYLPFNGIDVLISNPPYIAQSESSQMKENVTRFEPDLALFVPDADPLVFYRRIAQEGRKILKKGGMVIVEINERFGRETADLMEAEGLINVSVVRDLSGKNRIVKAYQP